MTVVGGLEDQITLLLWSQISNVFLDSVIYQHLFFELVNPLSTNQPIFWVFISVFLRIFGNNSYNLFLILTFILNLFFSLKLFRRYRYGLVYALIFVFSSYFWIHFGAHPVLPQVWLIPMFLNLLFKYDPRFFNNRERLIISGALLGVILVSNYIGFFLIIFLGLYTLLNYKVFKQYFKILVVTFFGALIFLWPFISSNYFRTQSPNENRGYASRSYEDFFTFSARPWYFVIPPVKNPFFGEVSKEILTKIESTHYFLSDDYFGPEHSGNYFGILLILFTLISSIYVFRNGDKKLKNKVLNYWIILGILFALMFPPFFTISGIRVYTPGWLFHKFFPMFRVTARISIVMLAVVLVLLGESMDFVAKKFEGQRILTFLMALLLFATLAETYVPLKIQKYDEVPEVYLHIKGAFAVYPYSEAREALFWFPVHKQQLLNPRDYVSGTFNAEEFTEGLETKEGIEDFIDLGGEYLIVRKNSGFENIQNLILAKEFDQHSLYSIF